MGTAYGTVVVSTIFLFFVMILVCMYSPYVPEELLGLRASEPYEPSALGFSATVLILMNTVSWPGMKSDMLAKNI